MGQIPGVRNRTLDSIVVRGLKRLTRRRVISLARLPTGQEISYRDVQRAISSLYSSGQFDDIRVFQDVVDGKQLLILDLKERPILAHWDLRGVEKLTRRTVRGRVRLLAGRPYDPVAAAGSRAAIDSLYDERGYYQADVKLIEQRSTDGSIRVIFDIKEGSKVAISQVAIEGNEAFTDNQIAGNMKTKPEGFWWFRRGEYDEEELMRDIRERIPEFYGSRGYVDFQVVDDTLIVNDETGKGLLQLSVREGDKYEVGTFEILGNRQYTAEQLKEFYPFKNEATGFLGLGGARRGRPVFDEDKWLKATQDVFSFYSNNGYLRADIRPIVTRRKRPDGTRVVDLRWQINEGVPSVINKVMIKGNTTTHEDVIRRAILTLPGDVFRQDAMIRSWQNIANLGFFEQPVPFPEIEFANRQGDVDITYRVTEKNTGNFNFGASVGQGTGLGGFIGMDQPNLFGRGKRVQFQWQFGSNIQDFNITYTDPAIKGGLVSGTFNLHSTRLRFTVGDLGRITTRGGSVQLGFPLFGSRFTRIFGSYTLEQSDFDSPTLSPRFNCVNCILSSLGMSVQRDTRIDMPFPSGGTMHQVRFSQAGGPLGGSGNFRRATFEGRWYSTLAQLGGRNVNSNPLKVVMGYTARVGFVWGNPGPHFRQLFAMGGTQFGIPLRGYDEFSITPAGFDPTARGRRANTVDAFARSYFAMTGEIGLRISQMLYLNTFFDAGNVWAQPRQFNPTNLFRGAGIGLNLISPLGPLGLDYAYGFDRTDLAGNPDPGWKLHFKLGNIF